MDSFLFNKLKDVTEFNRFYHTAIPAKLLDTLNKLPPKLLPTFRSQLNNNVLKLIIYCVINGIVYNIQDSDRLTLVKKLNKLITKNNKPVYIRMMNIFRSAKARVSTKALIQKYLQSTKSNYDIFQIFIKGIMDRAKVGDAIRNRKYNDIDVNGILSRLKAGVNPQINQQKLDAVIGKELYTLLINIFNTKTMKPDHAFRKQLHYYYNPLHYIQCCLPVPPNIPLLPIQVQTNAIDTLSQSLNIDDDKLAKFDAEQARANIQQQINKVKDKIIEVESSTIINLDEIDADNANSEDELFRELAEHDEKYNQITGKRGSLNNKNTPNSHNSLYTPITKKRRITLHNNNTNNNNNFNDDDFNSDEDNDIITNTLNKQIHSTINNNNNIPRDNINNNPNNIPTKDAPSIKLPTHTSTLLTPITSDVKKMNKALTNKIQSNALTLEKLQQQFIQLQQQQRRDKSTLVTDTYKKLMDLNENELRNQQHKLYQVDINNLKDIIIKEVYPTSKDNKDDSKQCSDILNVDTTSDKNFIKALILSMFLYCFYIGIYCLFTLFLSPFVVCVIRFFILCDFVYLYCSLFSYIVYFLYIYI